MSVYYWDVYDVVFDKYKKNKVWSTETSEELVALSDLNPMRLFYFWETSQDKYKGYSDSVGFRYDNKEKYIGWHVVTDAKVKKYTYFGELSSCGNYVYAKWQELNRITINKRGGYIKTIVGGANEYSGLAYERRGKLPNPDITSPSGGEVVDGRFPIAFKRESGSLKVDIDLSINNGRTWYPISRGRQTSPLNYSFSSDTATTTARLRIRSVDASGNTTNWRLNPGVFTIEHDVPPSAPTGLYPRSGTVDNTVSQNFSWTHNHPKTQSKFDLQWSTDQRYWNTTTIARSSTNVRFSANTFPSGTIYWKVRTYSDAGLVSDWSSTVSFLSRALNLPSASITSPSGGEMIDKKFLLTWSKDSGASSVDIQLSLNNGRSWKNMVTSATGTSLNYDFTKEVETSTARLRIRATDRYGNNSSWRLNSGVFTIVHDVPPEIPSRLTPSGGEPIDSTTNQRLTWKHNHPNTQSKFDLAWGTSQNMTNEINRTSTNEYLDIASDTFPEGEIYWKVRTYSGAGLVSDWSQTAIFTAATPSDAPAILSPSEVNGANPTFKWSQPDQVKYEIELLDSIRTVVWETGQVTSINKAITSGYDLEDKQRYTFRIRTASDSGLWTSWAEQKISVSYTPPPVPTIELIESDGFIAINVANPRPSDLEPNVLYNDIYRDDKRIATKVGWNYKDYTVRSDKEYSYRVVANADNDTVRSSEYRSGSITLKSSMLGNLAGESVELQYNPQRSESREQSGSLMFFAGRSKPVMQYSEHVNNSLPLAFKILTDEELGRFKDMVNHKELLLYRDNRGRKMFGTVASYDISDDIVNHEWYEISFTFQELDYSEVV